MRPRRPRSRSSSGVPRPAPPRRVGCSRRWREMAATEDRLLTAAEEIQLAKRIERGDLTAKRAMIERNLRLVYWLAERYRGRGAPYDDLVPGGTAGLRRPLAKVGHRPGLQFSTPPGVWVSRSLPPAVGA